MTTPFARDTQGPSDVSTATPAAVTRAVRDMVGDLAAVEERGADSLPESDLNGVTDIRASLRRMGLIGGEEVSLLPLTGGVSSQIVLVEAGDRRFCHKLALAKLNVDDDWYAPVERSQSEVQWIRKANRILPGLAPRILAVDQRAPAFAMEYLPADRHPGWKAELQRGSRTAAPAAAAGRALAALHGATAGQPDVASNFANQDLFQALRIEPFFEFVAGRHRDLGEPIGAAVKLMESAGSALIHGDFSPKNILIGGKHGIIVLDAECATFGDPAFDYAFCLTHLLLKARAYAGHRPQIVAAITAFKEAYRLGVTWEAIATLERRSLAIMPILMLARVDGKSPVEYLQPADGAVTRDFARARIGEPSASSNLEAFLGGWFEVAAR